MKEVTVNLIEHIGQFGRHGSKNWEVNIASWCDREPKLDIRAWDDEHEYPSKGITLTDEEGESLYKVLKARYEK